MPVKPLDVLDQVAADAGEIWCLCYVKTKSKPVQLKLLSRKNQASLEASACYETKSGEYKTEKEKVATVRDGILALAKKWKGKIDISTFKAGAKKSPVRGKQLEVLLQATLYEHFDRKLPKEVQTAFDEVASKFAQGELKKITRASAPKKAPVKSGLDKTRVYNALTDLGIQSAFVQREVAVLKRKTVTKRDPYDAILTVLTYLYCDGDTDRFIDVFREFFESDMESHFAQTHNLWGFVESSILRYSDLTGDTQYDRLIRERGFVEDRTKGSMLKHVSNNVQAELAAFDLGNSLPKGMIVIRYRSLITECLVMLLLGKRQKKISNHLNRYRQLFVGASDSFRLNDERFIASLRDISDELA